MTNQRSTLPRIAPEAALARAARAEAFDDRTLASARAVVEDVRTHGEAAIRREAERFGEITPGAPLFVDRVALRSALDALPTDQRRLLERTAERIRGFALAQRAALADVTVPIPGGRAGHRVTPVDAAGCYAPGGRYPLPSSVLMTAVTARAAGVPTVVVASPRPTAATLAAAAIAGADVLLPVGGAHAIAALAFGTNASPRCDVVCGPGNRWVTAAKHEVSRSVRIDMLAGPSELVVLADDTADAATVAADLLAQAEHDDDALPVLVTTSAALADRVDAELARQLEDLPSAPTARVALARGFVCVCETIEAAARVCDALAPEHLEVHTENPEHAASLVRRAGAVFIGAAAAEALGDYGAGPNHTLPTGGTARARAGLSVLDFLRFPTFIHTDNPDEAADLARDAAALARLESLEAHARSAERRSPARGPT